MAGAVGDRINSEMFANLGPQKTARELENERAARVSDLVAKGAIKDPTDPHRQVPAAIGISLPHGVAGAPAALAPAAAASAPSDAIPTLVQEILTADGNGDETAAQRAADQIVESYSQRHAIMSDFLNDLSLASLQIISGNPRVISRLRQTTYSKAIQKMIDAVAAQSDPQGISKNDLRIFLTNLILERYPAANVREDFRQALGSRSRETQRETLEVHIALRQEDIDEITPASCCLIL